MPSSRKTVTITAAILTMLVGTYYFAQVRQTFTLGVEVAGGANAQGANPAPVNVSAVPNLHTVELNDKQLATVEVETVKEYEFPVEKSAVGSIDFNEDMTVQVFTPYQGKIIDLFAKVGDEVKKGQTLFTIDSPDLLAAESNLIAAAGVTGANHPRIWRASKMLYETRAVAQKDLEQGDLGSADRRGAL